MTGASDPGFIASLTTVHLLLLAVVAAAVILVMVVAARRRARATRSAEAGERRREEAFGDTDDPVAGTEPDDAETPPTMRVDAQTAPPPPPLADAMPLAPPPPPEATGPVRSGRIIADAPDSDDLTQLKGVGPKLAQRLGELGYTRFSKIAALSAADAVALDGQLGSFQGRMARDRWIEQAGYLARGDRAGYEAVFGRL